MEDVAGRLYRGFRFSGCPYETKPEFLTQTCLSEGAHWDPHVFLYGKRYPLILKPSSAPEAINFTIDILKPKP